MGSTRVARIAGTRHAATATASSAAEVAAKIPGLVGAAPQLHQAIRLEVGQRLEQHRKPRSISRAATRRGVASGARKLMPPAPFRDRPMAGRQFLQPPRVHLVTQFYEPPWNHRTEEIRTCLVRNCENPHIFRIHLFDESAGLDSQLRTQLAEKLVHLPCTGRRLTFQRAADYADQALGGEICVLANADVYFDDSLSQLARFFGEEGNRVSLALLRHDVGEDGLLELRELNNFSQDAWCFVPPAGVRDADFHLGANACDNRFAWELRRAGLRPRNPCRVIRACHLHRDQTARSWWQQPRVEHPYLLVEPESESAGPEGPRVRHRPAETPRFSAFLVVEGGELTLPTTLEPLQRFLDSGGEVVLLELDQPDPQMGEIARIYGCTLASAGGECTVPLSGDDRSRLLGAFGELAGELPDTVVDLAAARNRAARLCASDLVLCVDSREAVHLDLEAIDRLLGTAADGATGSALPDGGSLRTKRSVLYDRRRARWVGFGPSFETPEGAPRIGRAAECMWSRDIPAIYQPMPRILNVLLELVPRVERGENDRVSRRLEWNRHVLRRRLLLAEAAILEAIRARLETSAGRPGKELPAAVRELVALDRPDLAVHLLDGVMPLPSGNDGQLVGLAEVRLEVARCLLRRKQYRAALSQAEAALVSLAQGLVEDADHLRASLHALSSRALWAEGRHAEAAHHHYRCGELDPSVAAQDRERFRK